MYAIFILKTNVSTFFFMKNIIRPFLPVKKCIPNGFPDVLPDFL
jgi:hypothetical protein